jgi:hypothetical protein
MTLDLSSNNITNEGLLKFLIALKGNQTLVKLDLSKNDLSFNEE